MYLLSEDTKFCSLCAKRKYHKPGFQDLAKWLRNQSEEGGKDEELVACASASSACKAPDDSAKHKQTFGITREVVSLRWWQVSLKPTRRQDEQSSPSNTLALLWVWALGLHAYKSRVLPCRFATRVLPCRFVMEICTFARLKSSMPMCCCPRLNLLTVRVRMGAWGAEQSGTCSKECHQVNVKRMSPYKA